MRINFFLYSIILIVFSFESKLFSQSDGHIDPSPTETIYYISFARHAEVSFTESQADELLSLASEIVQECAGGTPTSDQDVGCQITFKRKDSIIKTFNGVPKDIRNETDEDFILNIKTDFVKIIQSAEVDGIVKGGRAISPSSTMYLSLQNKNVIIPIEHLASIFAHEFLHTQGLQVHRETPGKPLMSEFFDSGKKEINQLECELFHDGHNSGESSEVIGVGIGQRYRPVDAALVIDNTGSMEEEIKGVRNDVERWFKKPEFSTYPCGWVFRLTTFKDSPSIVSREPTTSTDDIKKQVNAISVSGGDDCPESALKAIFDAAQEVKDGGVIYVWTDAADNSDIDNTFLNGYLGERNIKVYFVLSGTCDESADFITATDLKNNPEIIPFSNNDVNAPKEGTILQNLKITQGGAIETYSFLAEETGGKFLFIPQVNSGNPDDELFYENAVFNLLVGSTSSSIISAESSTGTQGGTLGVRIEGFNTHFDNTTSLSFSNTDITVNSFDILSPIEINANISIGSSAVLGFSDITATTNLSGGSTETSIGVGVFKVIEANTAPAILGIYPPTARQGETVRVTVYGQNTHFDLFSSSLSLGEGIHVYNIFPKSNEVLEADLHIDFNANTGFRDVTVTTGNEVATENTIGPFLVVFDDIYETLSGHWRTMEPSDDPQTIIRREGYQMFVHNFDNFNGCTPTDPLYCDWGEQPVEITASASSTRTYPTLELIWDRGATIDRDSFVLVGDRLDRYSFRNYVNHPTIDPDRVFRTLYRLYRQDCFENLDIFYVEGSNETYWASDDLMSNGVIESDQIITFKGGNTISLEAGFHAKAGSNFTAIIEDCNVNVVPLANARTEEETPVPEQEKIVLQIIPNPLTDEATIRFYLPVQNTAKILVFDFNGRLVSEQVANSLKGWNDTKLAANNLSAGMYYVTLQTDSEILTEKAVIVR